MRLNEDFFDGHETMQDSIHNTFADPLTSNAYGIGTAWHYNLSKNIYPKNSSNNTEIPTFDMDEAVRVLKKRVAFIRNFSGFTGASIEGIEASFIYSDKYPEAAEYIDRLPDTLWRTPIHKKAVLVRNGFASLYINIDFTATVDLRTPKEFIMMADAMLFMNWNDGYRPIVGIHPFIKPENMADMTMADADYNYITPEEFDDESSVYIILPWEELPKEDSKNLCYMFLDKYRTDILRKYILRKNITRFIPLTEINFNWNK